MQHSLVILILLFTSCSPLVNEEVKVLHEIIERDFANCLTHNKLIPIKLERLKDFNFYKEELYKNSDKRLPSLIPAPTNSNPSQNVSIGRIPLSFLIRDDLISKNQYNNLIAACKLKEGLVTKMETNQTTAKTYLDAISSKSVDQYQEFGYPILADDILIIYRNIYEGLLHDQESGLTGNGTFYVYSKLDGEWVLINKITKWIT